MQQNAQQYIFHIISNSWGELLKMGRMCRKRSKEQKVSGLLILSPQWLENFLILLRIWWSSLKYMKEWTVAPINWIKFPQIRKTTFKLSKTSFRGGCTWLYMQFSEKPRHSNYYFLNPTHTSSSIEPEKLIYWKGLFLFQFMYPICFEIRMIVITKFILWK